MERNGTKDSSAPLQKKMGSDSRAERGWKEHAARTQRYLLLFYEVFFEKARFFGAIRRFFSEKKTFPPRIVKSFSKRRGSPPNLVKMANLSTSATLKTKQNETDSLEKN